MIDVDGCPCLMCSTGALDDTVMECKDSDTNRKGGSVDIPVVTMADGTVYTIRAKSLFLQNQAPDLEGDDDE